jgi:hypothetical protein
MRGSGAQSGLRSDAAWSRTGCITGYFNCLGRALVDMAAITAGVRAERQ